MKKLIDVTVPVSADDRFCDECTFCLFGNCILFGVPIEWAATCGKYLKCQPCLDALTKSEDVISVKWEPGGAGPEVR